MTLVVALHLNTYALVAADSRVGYYHEDGTESRDDEYRKVHVTHSGVVAGSGLTLVTDWVIEQMKNLPKGSPSGLQEVMRARHDAVISQLPNDPRVRLAAARTGWILTTRRRGRLQVEFYQSEFDFLGREVNIGFPISLLPHDAGMEVFEPHLIALKGKLKPLNNLKTLDASIDYHLPLLMDIMRVGAVFSSTVGPAMQVGFYTERGEAEVMTDLISVST